MRTIRNLLVIAAVVSAVGGGSPVLAGASARSLYENALAREQKLRNATPTLKELRATIAEYEAVVRRYPGSGYSDNALWQASGLALLAFERFGEERDRAAGLAYLNQLSTQYASSSLVKQVQERSAQFDAALAPAPEAAEAAVATSGRSQSPAAKAAVPTTPPTTERAVAAERPAATPPKPDALVQLQEIRRIRLPGVVRVVFLLDAPVTYREERLAAPDRVFFDLQTTKAVPKLSDTRLKFTDDVVREIRTGRHPNNTTRVVLDLTEVSRYHVFTMENPYRLVIDCERLNTAAITDTLTNLPSAVPERPVASGAPLAAATPAVTRPAPEKRSPPPPPPPLPPTPPPTVIPNEPEVRTESVTAPAPAEPSATVLSGTRPIAGVAATPGTSKYSISRQLGLGVSRIVIDPGHGGHDPGTQHNGLKEAEVVLDVALRLEKLLAKQQGLETVLTRRTDTYVAREERTALANREGADLFISIHANASNSSRARGVETYFLNFASGPDAEAVAARENAGGDRRMHNLPEIVRAIALNNKLDESKGFAGIVQAAMVKGLSSQNKGLRNLGVKQAPFIVLIGAEMPSVLAEISFVTNKEEARLLKTAKYRQRIAESLFEAIQQYRRSFKTIATIAAQ